MGFISTQKSERLKLVIRKIIISLVLLATVQPALDASQSGDTIRVAPGHYRERISLKPGIILRSDGDDGKGVNGLKRAEATVIDGGGKQETAPGVVMAEGSTLDGFTITNVGVYDDNLGKKHFDSHGEELGDDEGSVQAEGTTPAIRIQGVNCTVTNCIAHHNGDVGIGILGKENTKTAPLITSNLVYRNMGGGIGVAEEAEPIIRGNTCNENLRAGIGCGKASPIIIDNLCFQNIRAGIGSNGASPLTVGNECIENAQAGIGLPGQSTAVIHGNNCHDNSQVAIGITEGSTAIITKNELARTGGVPPIIAVRDDSTVTIRDNRISGGGVAAVLVQGTATISGNTFTATEEKQGNAIWIWEGSSATVSDNTFDGYRAAVNAAKATVIIKDNKISRFQGAAIFVKYSPKPVYVFGNTGVSIDPKAKIVDVQGSTGTIERNVLKSE